MSSSDIITAFAETFRNFEADGVPTSGKHVVQKADMRGLGPVIATAVTGAEAGSVRAETWAALAGITGTRAGQPAEVLTGVATHLDPVSGDTVANKGQYRWSTAPVGWRWIADLDDFGTRLDGLDVGLEGESDRAIAAEAALSSALSTKAPIASPTFTGTVSGVTKAHVGLGSVDNTSDAAKPVSTAQQAALDAKAPIASPTFTGTVSGVSKGHVGLGNVDNTADAVKPVSTAQQAAIDAVAVGIIQTQGRPGDAALRYTSTVTGEGAAGAAPAGVPVVSAAGSVRRVTGAGIVALRERVALLPGQVIEATFVAQRVTDPEDPAGDAVGFLAQPLDYAKAALGSPIVVDDDALFVAEGERKGTARFALDAGDGIDFVAPDGTTYLTFYTQNYGLDGVTDDAWIEWADVSDRFAASALIGGLDGRLGTAESGLAAAQTGISGLTTALTAEGTARLTADNALGARVTSAEADIGDTRETIRSAVGGDGLTLVDPMQKEYFEALPDGTIFSRYLRIDPVTGGFEIGDGKGHWGISVDADGVTIGGLTIGYGEGGIAILDAMRRSPIWLDAHGLHLEGYITEAKFLEAMPRVEVDAPIIWPELFFVSGSRQPLQVRNLQPVRTDQPQAIVSFIADRAPPLASYAVTARDGAMEIEGDRIGDTAILMTRPSNSSTTLLTVPMAIWHKALPIAGAPAPKILSFGDSITNRQTLFYANTYLTSWGIAPVWLGTINTAADDTTTNASGPRGEGREGWSYRDFAGVDIDADVTSILAPGDEAVYAAMTKSQRRFVNPYVNPAGDLDLALYFGRWSGTSLDTAVQSPDIIPFNVGMNDVLERGAGAVEDVATHLPIWLDQLRDLFPLARILLWQTTTPRDPIADERWATAHRAVISKTIEIALGRRAAGYSRIHMVNVHAMQSREGGFALFGGTTNPLTGVTTTSFADGGGVHPTGVNRNLQARLLAEAIACLV